MKNRKVLLRKQAGVVLVVSMVMLILLTLIGVTGSQVTSLEEKMAGNARDQNTAFQVAEAALRAAEQFVLTNPPDTTYTGAGGLLFNDDVELDFDNDGVSDFLTPIGKPDFFVKEAWTVANSASTANFGDNFINNDISATVVNNPRYIIKRIDQFPDRTVFRITVRAVGHNPGTQVVLQEVFERPTS